MNIKIIGADKKYTKQIVELEEKVWSEPGVANKYDVANLIDFGYVYIALDNDKVVGAIIGFKTREDNIFVNDFVVNEEYRGYGIGYKLYNKLLNETKENVIAYVDDDYYASIHLHKKLGFILEKKVKSAFGDGNDSRLIFELKRR